MQKEVYQQPRETYTKWTDKIDMLLKNIFQRMELQLQFDVLRKTFQGLKKVQ